MTGIDRRSVMLTGIGAGAAVAVSAGPRDAQAATNDRSAIVSATAFGVQPDLGRDQTAVLQNAIEVAAQNRQPLFIPAGSYRVKRLDLKPDSHLVGVPGRSILMHEGDSAFLTAKVADNVRLSGIVLDGGRRSLGSNKRTAALFFAEDCQRLALRDCDFVESSADGVSLKRCSGAVSDCRFTDIRHSGLFSIDAKGLALSHNHVSGCGDNGIQVWKSAEGEDGTLITNNRIESIRSDSGGTGQNGNGIVVFRAGSVIAQGNRITDCAFSAIRANAASNVQMISNNCARLGEVALYAEFGFEGAIISNNIVDRAAAGISITNFKDHGGRLALAQGNLLRNFTLKTDSEDTRGFGIAVEADTIVSGNVIESAEFAGIAIGWGAAMRDVTATGNIIRNARIGIGVSVHPEAGYGYITNNMISGTRDGAVRAMNFRKLLGSDLVNNSAEVYRNIAVLGNVST